MKILVSGSSGLVGSALISFLTMEKHQVYQLVRTKDNLLPDEIAWDPQDGGVNLSLLEGFDAIVHLAGESIMGRWTEAKKKKIRESRVEGTRLLCKSLQKLREPPAVFICASAIGYYGNRGNEILTEHSSKGKGFLAEVCEEWEEATRAAVERGIRTVYLRFGAILSPKGGALKHMLLPFKWGLGGQMGPGTQYMSWIALDDVINIIDYVMHQHNLAGPINAVSPYPVTNAELTKILGRLLHRPTFFHMPTSVVKLIFGELGEELLLTSERVKPEKLEEVGFRFAYPHLEEALRYLLGMSHASNESG